jgi:hypothetical protein
MLLRMRATMDDDGTGRLRRWRVCVCLKTPRIPSERTSCFPRKEATLGDEKCLILLLPRSSTRSLWVCGNPDVLQVFSTGVQLRDLFFFFSFFNTANPCY